MKAQKQLKDLPGFDAAITVAVERSKDVRGPYFVPGFFSWASLGGIAIPGVSRILYPSDLSFLARAINDLQVSSAPHLCLVPPLRVAANDCEATNG